MNISSSTSSVRSGEGDRASNALHVHVKGEVDGAPYEGYVVIDTLYEGRSAGGVRIADDLRADEVEALAAEMSLKYALFGQSRGGAKAGVRLGSTLPAQLRLRALEAFGRRIGPLVQRGMYYPGMDMNCGPEELRAIYRGAGIAVGEFTDTSWFTALGVYHALESAVERASIGDGPVRLAIEGFGSVAAHLAARLDPARYRVVAVSTIAGAAVSDDPAGFDPQELARRRAESGDAFVRSLPGADAAAEDVLRAECDVLLPSARTWSIGPELARGLRTRAVVSIANAPFVGDAVDVLHAGGTICLPGYLCNCGGVVASSLFDQGVAREEVERLFATEYRAVVDAILARAAREARPATEIAEQAARTRVRERSIPRERSLGRRVFDRFLRSRLPRGERARRARAAFLTSTRSLRAELDGEESPR